MGVKNVSFFRQHLLSFSRNVQLSGQEFLIITMDSSQSFCLQLDTFLNVLIFVKRNKCNILIFQVLHP